MANITKIKVNGTLYDVGVQDTDNDTKNTVGGTQNNSSLYAVGTRSQSDSPQSYTDKYIQFSKQDLNIYSNDELSNRLNLDGASLQVKAYGNDTTAGRTMTSMLNFRPANSDDPYINFYPDYLRDENNTLVYPAELEVHRQETRVRDLKLREHNVGSQVWRRLYMGSADPTTYSTVQVGDVWIDTNV